MTIITTQVDDLQLATNLLFISNELLSPALQRTMRLPLTFITFAYVKGKMYRHYHSKSVFVLSGMKRYDIVYGAVFLLNDAEFYLRILDAHHTCSMSTLRRNHNLDMHHRISCPATPIQFNSLGEMGRLIYKEKQEIECFAYFGNIKHNKISSRLDKTLSYRIIDGVDKPHFRQLYEEVKINV